MDQTTKLTIKEFLEQEIFSLGKYSIQVYEVVQLAAVFIIAYTVDKLIKRFIYKSSKLDVGAKYATYQIFHYALIVITIFMLMKSVGINTSSLLVGSSAVLVGIGLGLQNLVLDFISGIIILTDRTIRVGDLIEVDNIVGKVQQIKIRTTIVVTAGNKVLYLPNSYLTKNKLINYSQNEGFVLYSIALNVHYNTDLDLAKNLMIDAAKENKEICSMKEPFVRLENFADSALEFRLYFYTEQLFRAAQISSDLREAVLCKFRENDIVIPYPTTLVLDNKK